MMKWMNYIFILLLIFGTVFASSELFVNKEIFPQWCVLITFTLLGILFYIVSIRKVEIDLLTFSIWLFLSYLIIRTSLWHPTIYKILIFIAFGFLYLIFKKLLPMYGEYINKVIVFVCLFQGIYGLLQFLGVINISSVFRVLGSYDNPAGFASCISAGLPFCFAMKQINKVYKIIIITILYVCIIISNSRAGLIAAGSIPIIYLLGRYRLTLLKKTYVKIIFAILIISILFVLFFYKKDSAFGRLLIWTNSLSMITKAPVFGSGCGSFRSDYMLHQADFFYKNPNSSFAILADNVNHPFNEFLLLTIEYGFFGFLLLILILWNLLKLRKFRNPYFLCVVTVALLSCFSYPFRYPIVCVLLAYCLAQYSNYSRIIWNFPCRTTLNFFLIGGVVLAGYYETTNILFEYRWKKLIRQTSLGKTNDVIQNYADLFEDSNGHALFLYNYGAELNHIGQYEKSILVLSKCKKYFNDYDVQMLLGDNHCNINRWEEAERYYNKAHNMIPGRFYSRYKLMNLYLEKGDTVKARIIAKEITLKEIKIPSDIIENIKYEATKVVKSSELSTSF